MQLLQFVIHRKTFISMLFLGLSLLGIVSYRNLPLELLPDAELPFLIVMVTSTSEVTPQYMEKQAIVPLEGLIGTLEGISSIESSAEQRQGRIIISFNQNVDIEYAYLKLSERITEVLSSLAEEFNVRVVKVDTENMSNRFTLNKSNQINSFLLILQLKS